MKYDRVRFSTQSVEDYRPITIEGIAPWWCSGYGFDPDTAIIVAYIPQGREVTEWWPEAEDIDVMQEDVDIAFSDRFPKPDWWTE